MQVQSLNKPQSVALRYGESSQKSSRGSSGVSDRFIPSQDLSDPSLNLIKSAYNSFQVNKSREANRAEEASSNYPGREGYDSNFLGKALPLPKLDASVAGQAAELIGKPGETELKYGHFSIVMNGERRQPFLTAVNIDGSKMVSVPRDGDWTIDSRIRRDQQLGNEAYKNNDIDKGHMVRRRDPGWGADAHKSCNDTFAYTNASLQHAQLNQKEWLELENHVLDQIQARDMKATVLTGPVFSDDDPKFNNKGKMENSTQIPQEFWKMVVWNDPQEGLKGSAFVLSQKDIIKGDSGLFKTLQEPSFDSGRFSLYQIPIADLEQKVHMNFGELVDSSPSEARRITNPKDAYVLS